MHGTILVTGAGGLLGSLVADRLATYTDAHVHGTYRSPLPSGPCPGVDAHHLDLTDRQAVSDLIRETRPRAVVHAAAAISNECGPQSLLAATDNNITATANLLAAMAATDGGRMVLCSSISVYGGRGSGPGGTFKESDPPAPSSTYAWSKVAGEDMLRLMSASPHGITGISLRLAGLHGSGRASGVVYNMIDSALRGSPLRVAEPNSIFNLLFLADAVQAIMLALDRPIPGGYACCNIGGDGPFTLLELAELVAKTTNSKSEIQRGDTPRERNASMSIALAQRLLGFEPSP